MKILKKKIPKFNEFPSYTDMKEYGGDMGVYGVAKWLYDNGEFPGPNVTLIIKDSNGNFLPDKSIQIILNGHIKTDKTDHQGKVIFKDLSPGTYITLTDNGYLSPNTFTIIDSNITINMTYIPIPTDTYKATLTLKNSSNGLIKNKEVQIKIDQTVSIGRTNSSGQVVFESLRVGNYTASVSDGYLSPNIFDIIDQDIDIDITYIPTPDKTYKTTLNIKDIYNTIVPFKEIEINLDGTIFKDITDFNGRVVFTSLMAGTYTVSVTDGTLSPNTFTISNNDIIVDIIYTPISTITYNAVINVKDDLNNQVPNKEIKIIIGQVESTYTTDSNGELILTNLIPGTYFVTTSNGLLSPDTFDIVDHDIIVTITYTSLYNATLSLKDSSDNVIPNKQVKIAMGQTEHTGMTDNNGEIYFAALIAGTYIISVEDGYLAPNIIDIIDSDVNVNVIYTPIPATVYKATLNIKDSSNNPVAVKEVEIEFNGTILKDTTDEQGTVIFNNLIVAHYTVSINNGILSPNTFDIVDQDITVNIIYTPDTHKATLNLKDSTNHPVTNKEVKIQLGSGTPITGTTDGTNGEVIFTGLSAGTWTVSVINNTLSPDFFIINNTDVTIDIICTPSSPTTYNATLNIKDSLNNAINNLTVDIIKGAIHHTNITDVQGMVNFTNLDIGVWAINVRGGILDPSDFEITNYDITVDLEYTPMP